jgi:hypothetical protein
VQRFDSDVQQSFSAPYLKALEVLRKFSPSRKALTDISCIEPYQPVEEIRSSELAGAAKDFASWMLDPDECFAGALFA